MKSTAALLCLIILLSYFILTSSAEINDTALSNNGTILNNDTLPTPSNFTTSLPKIAEADQLSKSSVFSTFLTLILCCLTQPYGSLLFIRRAGWFWRLSPISAIFETVIIAVYLITGRSEAVVLRPEDDDDDDMGELELQDPEDEEEQRVPLRAGPRAIMSRYLPSKLKRRRSLGLRSTMNAFGSFRKLLRIRGQKSYRWRTTAAALLILRNGKYRKGQRAGSHNVRNDIAVEHNWRLQIFTIVTVLFVLVKLMLVRGAPMFILLCLCYVLAWAAVEVLLLLTYWMEWTEDQIHIITTQYRKFDELSSDAHVLWLVLWGLVNFGLITAISYWGMFSFESSKEGVSWSRLFVGMATIVLLAVSLAVGMLLDEKEKIRTTIGIGDIIAVGSILVGSIAFAVGWYEIWKVFSGHPSEENVLYSSVGVLMVVGLLLSCVSKPSICKALGGLLLGFYVPLILYPLLWFWSWVALVIVVLGLVAVLVGFAFIGLGMELSEFTQHLSVNMVNVFVFVLGMTYYMYHYRPENTFRPGGLDWIGM